jgi:hypothetical protein
MTDDPLTPFAQTRVTAHSRGLLRRLIKMDSSFQLGKLGIDLRNTIKFGVDSFLKALN